MKPYSLFDNKFNIEVNKKHLFIKIAIWFLLVFMIFIFTLVRMKRIVVFIKIFNSTTVPVQITGIVIYFIAITFFLIYHIALLIYIYVKKCNNEEWYYFVHKITDKLDFGTFIAKSISILLFIFIFLINPCRVYGESMADTFHTGDRVITTTINTAERDDVIIFDASKYSSNEAFYIKRVIAVENDKLRYISGDLYVNDIKDERGNVTMAEFNRIVNGITAVDGYYIIPNNKIVVMGDNRLNSSDSRVFGLIDEDDVYGKVLFRFYPFSKISFF